MSAECSYNLSRGRQPSLGYGFFKAGHIDVHMRQDLVERLHSATATCGIQSRSTSCFSNSSKHFAQVAFQLRHQSVVAKKCEVGSLKQFKMVKELWQVTNQHRERSASESGRSLGCTSCLYLRRQNSSRRWLQNYPTANCTIVCTESTATGR